MLGGGGVWASGKLWREEADRRHMTLLCRACQALLLRSRRSGEPVLAQAGGPVRLGAGRGGAVSSGGLRRSVAGVGARTAG